MIIFNAQNTLKETTSWQKSLYAFNRDRFPPLLERLSVHQNTGNSILPEYVWREAKGVEITGFVTNIFLATGCIGYLARDSIPESYPAAKFLKVILGENRLLGLNGCSDKSEHPASCISLEKSKGTGVLYQNSRWLHCFSHRCLEISSRERHESSTLWTEEELRGRAGNWS